MKKLTTICLCVILYASVYTISAAAVSQAATTDVCKSWTWGPGVQDGLIVDGRLQGMEVSWEHAPGDAKARRRVNLYFSSVKHLGTGKVATCVAMKLNSDIGDSVGANSSSDATMRLLSQAMTLNYLVSAFYRDGYVISFGESVSTGEPSSIKVMKP